MSTFNLGMSGGKKAMWLRQNRQLVLDYYAQFSEALTLSQFNLKQSTLNSLLNREGIEKRDTRQDRAEALAEIALESSRETKREVRELQSQYEQFTEIVCQQLIDRFFLPLLKSVIKIKPSLELKPRRNLLVPDPA